MKNFPDINNTSKAITMTVFLLTIKHDLNETFFKLYLPFPRSCAIVLIG